MVSIVTLARDAMLTAEPHAGQSALCAECNTGAPPLNEAVKKLVSRKLPHYFACHTQGW